MRVKLGSAKRESANMVEGCTCMHATGLRWYEECFHRALTGLRVIRLELDKGHRVVRGVWS